MNAKTCGIVALIATFTWLFCGFITWTYWNVLIQRGLDGEAFRWAAGGCGFVEMLALAVALVMLSLGLMASARTSQPA